MEAPTTYPEKHHRQFCHCRQRRMRNPIPKVTRNYSRHTDFTDYMQLKMHIGALFAAAQRLQHILATLEHHEPEA